jgi:hypothetical protein
MEMETREVEQHVGSQWQEEDSSLGRWSGSLVERVADVPLGSKGSQVAFFPLAKSHPSRRTFGQFVWIYVTRCMMHRVTSRLVLTVDWRSGERQVGSGTIRVFGLGSSRLSPRGLTSEIVV